MSKTIYYIGAGASYGKRDDGKKITEGIPVVAEIPEQFALFRDCIATTAIPTDGEMVFQQKYRTTASNIDSARRDMLYDIDQMLNGIQEHATIDTYARKLYLTNHYEDFKRLKILLCSFFIWEQLSHKPDGRYDTFLANVLDNKTLNLPKEISFISWNYDSQIEIAHSSYSETVKPVVFEKNLECGWPSLTDNGRVFKVNGSATFANSEMVSLIKNNDKTPYAIQIIRFYSNCLADTSSMGFQYKTHLSFAWEKSPNDENMMQSLRETTKDAEQVVVIGYSFPFFNRETDRTIFRGMPNLMRVYVQDINPDAVIQSLNAVLPAGRKVDIVPVKNCEQFYLPAEL